MSTNTTAHTTAQNSYLKQRLEALGLTIDAASAHGLSHDAAGNILQTVRTFTGRPVLWQDRQASRKAVQRLENRKSFSENGGGVERFDRPLMITRYRPDNIPPGGGKYKYPPKDITNTGVKPIPSTAAIDAYNKEKTGGIGVGIEGYFKAVALSVSGIEAVAFTGISTYKMCDDLTDFIVLRRLDDFVILYDADARELKVKDGQTPSTTRILNFYNSAAKFAGAFYDVCQRHNLQTKLHFAIISETAGHKGIDDLLEANPDKRANIAEAFNTLKSSEYFTFIRLSKSKFTQQLRAFFALSDHNQFYTRYSDTIGLRPFKFGKATYQYTPGAASDIFDRPTSWIKLLDNPFAVKHPNTAFFTVKRYLSDIDNDLSDILIKTPRVCLSAPTGTGKNAFFLGYHDGKRRQFGYFEKTGTRGVITVPTVSLCKQLAGMFKIPALHGRVSIRDAERAAEARVIVCTYDTLHRVIDLYDRTLVVDEAHNLVNQYGDIEKRMPFRADVLRRIVKMFDIARATVLMSGTPPDMLASVLGFKMVHVARKENNAVFVRPVVATNKSAEALTAEALAQMAKMDLHDGRIRFVYYNSKKQIDTIKQGLIRAHGLTDNDIAIITRDVVADGTHAVYNGIINRSTIEGVKVVLSTCLIAEGINIKNTNIGEIITVGINCPDSFRQYVARFRSMAKIDVISIMPPERLLDKNFFMAATDHYDYLHARANLQQTYIEKSIVIHGDDVELYDTSLMPYIDDIEPNYKYRPELLSGVYRDDAGHIHIDTLYICAAIRERSLNTSNNAFFYARIIADNIHLIGTGEKDIDQTAAAVCVVNEAKDILKTREIEVIERLREDLQQNPAAVISAYYTRVTKTGNRHAVSRLEALVPDLINDTGADTYAAIRSNDIKEKYYSEALNRYIRAHAAAGYVGDAIDAIDEQPADFSLKYARFKRAVEIVLYNNRRHRINLKSEHKTEIVFYAETQKAIRTAAVNGVIKLSDVKKLIKDRTRITKPDGANIQVIRTTSRDIERMVKMLFDVTIEKMPSGERVYHLAELPPLPPIDNPVRFISIFG